MTEEKKNQSNRDRRDYVSVSLVSMGFTVVTPAIAVLGEHFAGKNVAWVSTCLPCLPCWAPALAGSVMGKKMKYRTLAILSGFLYVIGGCAPAPV